MRQVPKPKNPLDSFRYAVEGIIHTFRTQKHMRFHFFTVILVLSVGLLLRLGRVEMCLLFIVVSGVLVAEMMNTAIESVVDMVTQAYHPLAKLAKDIAGGGGAYCLGDSGDCRRDFSLRLRVHVHPAFGSPQ